MHGIDLGPPETSARSGDDGIPQHIGFSFNWGSFLGVPTLRILVSSSLFWGRPLVFWKHAHKSSPLALGGGVVTDLYGSGFKVQGCGRRVLMLRPNGASKK